MIMCVAAYEMKRLGLVQKPLIIGLKVNARLKNPCWRGIIKKAGVSTEKRKTANNRTHRSVPAANT